VIRRLPRRALLIRRYAITPMLLMIRRRHFFTLTPLMFDAAG